MKCFSYAILFAVAFASAGCFHAKVTTGLVPSATVIDNTFASSWVYGLVPPETIEAASECPNGVAIIETELSFVNQLVGFLTIGIYTPMHIKITCAESNSTAAAIGDPDVLISDGASERETEEAFNIAIDVAVATGEAVYVRFKQNR